MFEVTEEVTYPFTIRCRPKSGDVLNNRFEMERWLVKNVKWDKNLSMEVVLPEVRGMRALGFKFRVQSIEDVALVRMRM